MTQTPRQSIGPLPKGRAVLCLILGVVLLCSLSVGCTSSPVTKSAPVPYSWNEPPLEPVKVRVSNAPPDSSSAEDVPPYPVSEQYSKPPKIKFYSKPTYPSAARTAELEGTVLVTVRINEEGRVEHAEVVSGHEAFHKSAIEAVKQCVFEPAELDGVPVAVTINVPLAFKLDR